MSNIDKMIEQKKKLQEKIKKEKEKEYVKFGRWFFNKFNINSSAEAKKLVNKDLLNKDINSNEKNEYSSNVLYEENENEKYDKFNENTSE
ncbi:TPA: hypothetical protein O1H79_002715 [Staphylococcus aureus]|nr:hypothetical protein [Staphylococcus aureus]